MLDELLDDDVIEELLESELLDKVLEDELLDDSDEVSTEDDMVELLENKELLDSKELLENTELLEATEFIVLELEAFVTEELDSFGVSVLATQPTKAKLSVEKRLVLLKNILVMRISS